MLGVKVSLVNVPAEQSRNESRYNRNRPADNRTQ
jgi:hypothetical protein